MTEIDDEAPPFPVRASGGRMPTRTLHVPVSGGALGTSSASWRQNGDDSPSWIYGQMAMVCA